MSTDRCRDVRRPLSQPLWPNCGRTVAIAAEWPSVQSSDRPTKFTSGRSSRRLAAVAANLRGPDACTSCIAVARRSDRKNRLIDFTRRWRRTSKVSHHAAIRAKPPEPANAANGSCCNSVMQQRQRTLRVTPDSWYDRVLNGRSSPQGRRGRETANPFSGDHQRQKQQKVTQLCSRTTSISVDSANRA